MAAKAVLSDDATADFLPHQRDYNFQDGIKFSSCFESGNCAKVSRTSKTSFRVWTAPDCANTCFETDNRTWFYFVVSNVPKGTVISITIMNMNKQSALYSNGMKPVWRTANTSWARINRSVSYKVVQKADEAPHFKLTFHHLFTLNEPTYFSFCYPYTYSELQESLQTIENRMKDSTNIYFKREVLARSLLNRRVDLLTLTSLRVEHYETQLGTSNQTDADIEENENQNSFLEKPIVFVSARIHPGETPSSYSFNGLLAFLLNENDKRARMLRDAFVFKLVPMLNPDGVAHGHYRTDTRGVNLNRHYASPSEKHHPAVFAVKKLLTEYSRESKDKLYLYLDMHAHTNKRGCFLYGNHLPSVVDQVENMAYAHLVAMHSPFLDIDACNFSVKNMKIKDQKDRSVSREGSGRVGIYRATNLIRCYTLECNYNTGKNNPNGDVFYEYTPKTWADCGQGCALALLDAYLESRAIKNCNLLAERTRSKLNTLTAVKRSIYSRIKHNPTYSNQMPMSMSLLQGPHLESCAPRNTTKNKMLLQNLYNNNSCTIPARNQISRSISNSNNNSVKTFHAYTYSQKQQSIKGTKQNLRPSVTFQPNDFFRYTA